MRSLVTVESFFFFALIGCMLLTSCNQETFMPTNQSGDSIDFIPAETATKDQNSDSKDNGSLEPERRFWIRDFSTPQPYPVSLERNSNNFSLRSEIDGVLRSAVSQSMFSASNCDVNWALIPSESGVDLVYTIRNLTNSNQSLPDLQIGGLEFGDIIEYLDQSISSEFKMLDASGGRAVWSATAPYPQSLYSPLIIARNGRYAVGLSLQYPLLEYKHQIRTYIGRGPGPNDGTWNTRFHLDGELAPNQSRRYVVNIRYKGVADWIHSIGPYKEFLTRYGPIRYQQDLRPVWGTAIGDSLLIRSDNPRGINGFRADLNGWEANVNYILDWVVPSGFERVMVWTASGVYDENRQNNFPPQFMVEWTNPMIETESQWTRVPDAGVDLLFWWGRAGQYADRWNDDLLEKFSPDNPAQKTMMLNQWDLALARGASGLGLDAFTQMDAWDALPWIATLRERKPDATIVAEPVSYDILNLHVPTFLYSEDVENTPHYLADYLVPGREIWVYARGEGQTIEKLNGYIANGMTVLLRSKGITAWDLEEAVRNAQGGVGSPP